MRDVRFVFVPAMLAVAGTGGCGDSAKVKSGPPETAVAEDAGDGRVRTCSDAQLAGCTAGRCTVSGPTGTLPPEATLTIEDRDTPPELAGDATSAAMCLLTLPAGAPVTVTLSIDSGAPVGSGGVLFRYDAPQAFGLGASTVDGSKVAAFVSHTGLYGITQRPAAWSVEATIPSDPPTSDDTPSILRNISLQRMDAAYFDGARLFLGSGPRVLVYDGIPASPHVKPALVLGQPNLDTILPGTTSAILNTVGAIWSDGTKLAVANGNRVLIWNKIPTKSFVPADVVLGQQDFSTSQANVGGVSASTLSGPQALDSDGTRLIVGDTSNHRVLVWDAFPTSIGQPATSVLGQANFATALSGSLDRAGGVVLDGAGALTASWSAGPYAYSSLALNAPAAHSLVPKPSGAARTRPDGMAGASSVSRTQGGGVAIVDPGGVRIAIQRTASAAPAPIDFVLGQPDSMRTVSSPVSASTVSFRAKVASANGLFLVPDRARVLAYESAPSYHFEPASRVFGQAGFTVADPGADYRRTSARTLAYPSGVAAHGSTVAVADRGNNRVLLYPSASLGSTNAAATVVIGQPDATSFVPNVDQVSATAATLSGPSAVALDGSRLVVADTENHRVLIWEPVPVASGTPAKYVLGQANFSGRRPNRGRGDANGDGYSDAAADGLFYPSGVATDGTRLFVSDRLNHRVLVWNDMSTITNGKPADAVLGQPDFTSVLPNRGNAGAGGFHPRLDGLNLPGGIALVGTSLWIADTENNRVVRYDDVTTSPTPTLVLGQPDGTSLTNPNYYPESSDSVGAPLSQPTSASSILRPQSVVAAGDVVYVSERDANRVHLFDRTSVGAPYTHRGQLGQTSAVSASPNAGGLGAASMSAPAGLAISGDKLLVADSANHRVLVFPAAAPPADGAAASAVIGQASFVANGFNQSAAVTAGGANRPRGIALAGGELLVAETDRNRVVVHELPLVPGKLPKRIYGQPDPTVSLPNSGGALTARSLSGPRAVFADPNRILVADTANHRVLVYDRNSPSNDAVLVLGQSSFAEGAANRGGAASAATLQSPQGVFSDGQRLVVADTGNHRVLVWNTFPTTNGEPADVIIGQTDPVSVLSNRGTAVASGATLASPVAVHIVGGELFIADAGNNRVLRFAVIPTTSGAAASGVLGQPDAQTRVPSSSPNSATRLAGPVALASDGTSLFVADRDTSRIVAFPIEADTGAAATILFNPNSGLNVGAPAGLAVERTPLFTSKLYVADTNNDRLVVVESVSRLRGL